MKKSFITILMLLLSIGSFAVPAKRGQWKDIKLSDGTVVRAELCGDENVSFWRSENGQRYLRNSNTGDFVAVDLQTIQKKASEVRMEKQVSTALSAMRSPASTSKTNSAYIGDKRGLVVLVEFPDMKFTHGSKELYEKILNEDDYADPSLGFVGSVSDYFKDQSNGMFNLKFDVAGPVMMPEGYATYGSDNPRQDANIGEMLRNALNAIDGDIDFKKYDWNGDGQVEQVFFIYAGLGQANGGDENTIWPHKSVVLNASNTGYLYLDGMRIYDYACSAELQPVYNMFGAMTDTKIDGIGTICHEFSHCLGLADIYDIDYSGGYGMATWDLMSSGSYNENGFRPACYTGFERMQIGWEEPVELTENTNVRGMKSLSEGGEFYIVRNDANSDEYYILENRQRTGRWDAGLDGSGLLIVHVDYNKSAWDRNGPNDDPNHQRCTPIVADGLMGTMNIGTDAYPYGSNNSLTNETRPAASVFTKNTDGTYYMNKPITDITQNPDGTIDFNFIVMDTTPIFYESFDGCAGKGGNDGNFIAIGSSLGKGTLNTDNEGWTGNGGGASKCAMFNGEATTPSFNIDGKVEMIFSAGALATGVANPLMNLSVSGNATLSSTSFSMSTSKFTEYSVYIEGSGSIQVTFSSDATFFLDEVKVKKSYSSGINDVTVGYETAGSVKDSRIYSIDGRYLGTDVNLLPKGIYIMNGKKFVK